MLGRRRQPPPFLFGVTKEQQECGIEIIENLGDPDARRADKDPSVGDPFDPGR
jgi:hypothetical protein